MHPLAFVLVAGFTAGALVVGLLWLLSSSSAIYYKSMKTHSMGDRNAETKAQ